MSAPVTMDLPLFRASDPVTSKAGAAHVQPRTGTARFALLLVYRAHPEGLTAHEACEHAGLTSGGWKRVSDLLTMGLLADTGRTRPGPSGVAQRVLVVTEAGRHG